MQNTTNFNPTSALTSYANDDLEFNWLLPLISVECTYVIKVGQIFNWSKHNLSCPIEEKSQRSELVIPVVKFLQNKNKEKVNWLTSSTPSECDTHLVYIASLLRDT